MTQEPYKPVRNPDDLRRGQACFSSWDCGSNFFCNGGICEAAEGCSPGPDSGPDCGNDPRDGECLGPAAPPEPNQNGPNCGTRGELPELVPTKDCVFQCNNFCDEWDKISANLDDDSEIKDCNPDDACSVCKECVDDDRKDPDQEKAINKRYDDAIQDQKDLKELRQEQHIVELGNFDTTYNDARSALDTDIATLEGEESQLTTDISALNAERQGLASEAQSLGATPPYPPNPWPPASSPGGEPNPNQDRLNEIFDRMVEIDNELEDKNDRLEQIVDTELPALESQSETLDTDYENDREALIADQEAEINEYDDIIVFLQEEKKNKLEALDNRSICRDIPLSSGERPCYCPAYVDTEGNVVNDALNRECDICNVETGNWENREELCSDSCTRSVICDDGGESSATITAARGTYEDICAEAHKQAIAKCRKFDDDGRKCPCPPVECEVEGPLKDALVEYEINGNSAKILQNGDVKMSGSSGAYLLTNWQGLGGSRTQKVYIDPRGTLINGGNVKFRTEPGTISFGSGAPLYEISGSASISGEPYTGDILEIIDSNVTTLPEGLVLLYIWYADGLEIDAGLLQNDGVTPAFSEDYRTLTLPDALVGTLIQVGVTAIDPGLEPGEDGDISAQLVRPFVITGPVGPIFRTASQVNAAVSIEGNPVQWNVLSANDNGFRNTYPFLTPVFFSWIDFATGLTLGVGTYLYLDQGLIAKRIYVKMEWVDEAGDLQFVQSPATDAVVGLEFEEGENPIPECTPVNPVATIEGDLRENETLSAKLNQTGGISDGPWYQWLRNGELIPGAEESEYTLQAEDILSFMAVSITYLGSEAGCLFITRSLDYGPVENVVDEPTGTIIILGEANVGERLNFVSNIEHKDGMANMTYQWLADGVPIPGATDFGYDLTDSDFGRTITVRQLWTTFFEKDYHRDSLPTKPIDYAVGQVVIKPRSILGAQSDGVFQLLIDIQGLGDIEVYNIQTTLRWEDETEYVNITPLDGGLGQEGGEGEGVSFAENYGLTSAWDEVPGPDGADCPQGWDCFYSALGPEGKPVGGAKFWHKCPYPCHATQTYEEYLDNEPCQRSCEDRCYQYTITLPKEEGEPQLEEGEEIIETINTGTSVNTYIIEYCMEASSDVTDPNTGEKIECSRDQFLSYKGIFHAKQEGFYFWTCTCDVPLNERKFQPGGDEFFLSARGVGPWVIEPTDKGGGWPDYSNSSLPNNYLYYKVSKSNSIVDQSQSFICDFQQYGPNGNIRCRGWNNRLLANVCGADGKYSLLRSYVILDSNPNVENPKTASGKGTQTSITAGYTLWSSFDYAPNNVIVYNRSFDLSIRVRDSNGSWQTKFLPAMKEESRPPSCVWNTPEQIGYTNETDQIIFITDLDLLDKMLEQPQFSFMKAYSVVELEDGAPLYSDVLIRPPGPVTERPPVLPKGIPSVRLPDGVTDARFTWSPGSSYLIVGLEAVLAGNKFFRGDAWRFTENNTTQVGEYLITPSGQIKARLANMSPGTTTVTAQVYNEQSLLWSKGFPVTITVVA